MTPENFCYWLQGYFEISQTKELTKEQIDIIQTHLDFVFNKTPKMYRMPDFKKWGLNGSGYSGFVGKSGYHGYRGGSGLSAYSGFC